MTVIPISAIGFLNHVLLHLYSTRGLYYSAVFGGLMNSTAAVARLIPADGRRDQPADEAQNQACCL